MTADHRILPIFTTLLILIAAMLLLCPSSAGAIGYPDVYVSSDKATGTLYDIDVTADIDPDVSIDWDWWDTTIDISISVKFSISGKFDLQILKETLPEGTTADDYIDKDTPGVYSMEFIPDIFDFLPRIGWDGKMGADLIIGATHPADVQGDFTFGVELTLSTNDGFNMNNTNNIEYSSIKPKNKEEETTICVGFDTSGELKLGVIEVLGYELGPIVHTDADIVDCAKAQAILHKDEWEGGPYLDDAINELHTCTEKGKDGCVSGTLVNSLEYKGDATAHLTIPTIFGDITVIDKDWPIPKTQIPVSESPFVQSLTWQEPLKKQEYCDHLLYKVPVRVWEDETMIAPVKDITVKSEPHTEPDQTAAWYDFSVTGKNPYLIHYPDYEGRANIYLPYEEGKEYTVLADTSGTPYEMKSGEGKMRSPIVRGANDPVDIVLQDTGKVIVEGTKTWDDNNDADRKRPDIIRIGISEQVHGEVAATNVTARESWKWEVKGLPEMDEDGNWLEYYVTESTYGPDRRLTPGVAGYATEYKTPAYNTITNTWTCDITNSTTKRDIEFVKYWDDEPYQHDPITIKLLADGTQVDSKQVQLGEAGKTFVFKDKPVYDSSQHLINYTITEDPATLPSGYNFNITGNAERGFTIWNTSSNNKIDIVVNKTWVDNDNQSGKRPSQITIRVKNKKTGETVASHELSSTETNYTFTDLPKYEDPTATIHIPAEYIVTEDPVKGYTTTITGDQKSGFTITNTYTNTMTVTVRKEWIMADRSVSHPNSVTYTLKRNGSALGPDRTLSETNNWQETISNLPVYDDAGVAYTYTVEETVPDGYIAEYESTSVSGGMIWTIRNKQNTRKIKFKKVWEDGTAASDVTIYLVMNGTKDSSKKQVIKSSQASHVFSFDNLPVYDTNGKTILYTVMEDPVPDSYHCYITGTMENGFTVLNSKEDKETINITVTKNWDDSGYETKRPKEIMIRLKNKRTGEIVASQTLPVRSVEWSYTFTAPKYESTEGSTPVIAEYIVTEDAVSGYTTQITGDQNTGFTVTNTYTNKMTATVHKQWIQVDSSVTPPDHITFSLKQNDTVMYTGQILNIANRWQKTYKDLPIYDDNGKAYIYSVEESVPPGYAVEYVTTTIADEILFTIRNKQSTRTIRVEKVWDDGGTSAREDVTIWLLKNGSKETSKTIPASGTPQIAFTGLPVYDNDGNIIQYSVKEDPVPAQYRCTITGNMANGFTVTNKKENSTIEIAVRKIWDDNNDAAGKRPGQITVRVKNKETGQTVATQTITASDQWQYTFTNIPKYENPTGSILIPISYVVTEDPVEGYTTNISGNQDDGFKITNTFSETMRIIVGKEWVMADKEATHPDSVTFSLLRNGIEWYTGQTLSKEDNWQKVYDDMPVYDGSRQKYTYSVVETVPDGYTVEYNTRTISGGVVLTIRNKQNTRDIQFKKVWDDDDPSGRVAVTISLNNGSGVVRSKEIKPDDAGKEFTFEDLPVYNGDRMIEYTITEDQVPDQYHCYITGSMDEGFTILNSKEDKGKINVAVKKIWDDNDDESHLRPNEIVIRLKKAKTGETVAVKILPIEGVGPDEKWNWTFKDVPKEESGTPIIYTVTEDPISYYHTVISGNQNTGFTITNQLKTIYEDITVTKTWVKQVDHPDTLSVTLYSDADYPGAFIPVATTTLSKPNWQYVFENMPATSGDRNISYRVTEEVPAGYEYPMIVYAGNTIQIHNWITDQITMDIQKEWVGDKAKDRPESLTVRVKTGDSTKKTIELTAENGWKAHIDHLPILRTGRILTAIPFKVEEDTPEGYSGTVTGGVDETGLHYNYTITNELEPAPTHEPTPYTYRFAFTKVWSNDREDSIDWTLYNGNGQVVHKRFNKKAISDMEWVYEAWFASDVSEYYIVENIPAGYRVTYDNKGIHADVDTRCYNGGTIINYKIPKTGDTTQSDLPWILCLIAGLAGAACVIFALRKRSGGR